MAKRKISASNISAEAAKSFSEVTATTPRKAAINFLVGVISAPDSDPISLDQSGTFSIEKKIRASEILLKYAGEDDAEG